MIVPWFLGGPWVPKFEGGQGQMSFGQWRTQIESFLRAQTLNTAQGVDFVLSALQGDARREVLLLPEAKRRTVEQILQELQGLYGEKTTAAQLRTQFFSCKQRPGEGVNAYILRLRECLYQWSQREVLDPEATDENLRSQLMLGLLPGPIQIELQRLLRRAEPMTFVDLCKEAKAVEHELQTPEVHTREVHSTLSEEDGNVQRVAAAVGPHTRSSLIDWQSLKEALRSEMMAEVREQMSTLKGDLLGEIKQQLQGFCSQQSQGSSRQAGRGDVRPREQRRANRTPRWDDQGRPICLQCGRVGHMQRHCPSRGSNQGF
ncbi:hypothetical protein ACEWY4_007526 [Coilia grayii]|uniref:CCHC-type domain-containing protein n=1 Tax=Coilia grayii TaxID=363190 RepID=A0ABD1KGR8_9TELE